MACPNCDGLSAFWCPACSLPLPSKPVVCPLCHDATCPCGKVMLRTDAELIDALRACRWILSQQVAAKDAELARLRAELDLVKTTQHDHYMNWLEQRNKAMDEADRLRACIAEVKELTDTLKLPRAKAYGLVRASLVAIIAKHEVSQ